MLDQAYERTMEDIRKKWESAERLVLNCDPKSVYTLSEIDVLLERYKEYKYGKQWEVLSEDQEIIKKEFVANCACKGKRSKRWLGSMLTGALSITSPVENIKY